jgi:hypothetical protein
MAKSFKASLLKLLPADFVDTANSMTEKELGQRILEVEKGIMALKEDAEADTALEAAKNELKELRSVYSIPIKENRAIIEYCLWVLQSRGKV